MRAMPSTPMPPAFETSTTTSRQWEKAKIGTSIPNISQSLFFMSHILFVFNFFRRSAGFAPLPSSDGLGQPGDNRRKDTEQDNHQNMGDYMREYSDERSEERRVGEEIIC